MFLTPAVLSLVFDTDVSCGQVKVKEEGHDLDTEDHEQETLDLAQGHPRATGVGVGPSSSRSCHLYQSNFLSPCSPSLLTCVQIRRLASHCILPSFLSSFVPAVFLEKRFGQFDSQTTPVK